MKSFNLELIEESVRNILIALGTVQFGLNYGISNTTGQVPLDEIAKILDFDMMIDTNECYETLWASIYDSIYTKCLQNNDPIQLISLGSQHTICVTNKGKVYTFGWNNYGQCGVPINSTVVLKSELEDNRLININKFNELELRILNRIDGVKIPQIDEIILSNSMKTEKAKDL